jgi:hypothetical protein
MGLKVLSRNQCGYGKGAMCGTPAQALAEEAGRDHR